MSKRAIITGGSAGIGLETAKKFYINGFDVMLCARNKENLDRVTFEMLRISNQNLAAELYYRLMAKEQSFQQLSWDYGEGPEKKHAGKFQDQCLKDLPAGISPLLRRMKPNEPAKPRRFGKFFVILNLVQITSAQYDQNMKDYLLENQLNGLFAEIRQSLLPDNIE